MWTASDIWIIPERWTWSSSFFFFKILGRWVQVLYEALLKLTPLSSCWLTLQVWGRSQSALLLLPSAIPFHCPYSWDGWMYSSVIKGSSFHYRSPATSKLESDMGLSPFLWVPAANSWVPVCPCSLPLHLHLFLPGACLSNSSIKTTDFDSLFNQLP